LYEAFPENIHRIIHFATTLSISRLQQILTETIQKLNKETFNLEEITTPSTPQCTVTFEIGIAETNTFNYLNEEETKKMLRNAHKKPFGIIDFLWVIKYHKQRNEKKTPLRFDYYMIRFAFSANLLEMRVFHERGPRYVSPQEIAEFIANKTNDTSSKKILKILQVL
jgi:hypothetical protein